MTNLMDFIDKEDYELDVYLENFSAEEIKADIIYTVSINTPKEALNTLINTLIKIRDGN